MNPRSRIVAGLALGWPIVVFIALWMAAFATSSGASPSGDPSNQPLIQPDELVKILQSPKADKPLLFQVGFYSLYAQAHIPGSQYLGPTAKPDALDRLRKRVEKLPRGKFIVLYCGCCPWSHCPNISPAYEALKSMSFTNVKLLYIPGNFGADWVNKGYPVTQGD